jgi:GTP-binding protein LepA
MPNIDQSHIRNFSIIAHIDHGKSTLADRLMEHTHAISQREFHDQMLDDMDLERERGITIKASAVTLDYKAKNGEDYLLNLIDTPGHVDFTYEVSKSLAACEGALLVVDAAQGVEAQTVANLYLAMEHNLKIIPVINKIDLNNADPARVKDQIVQILRLKEEDIIYASAKEGVGIDEILEAIVSKIPAPKGKKENPLQGFIFDSKFDSYRGVIVYLRLFNGVLNPNTEIKMLSSGKNHAVQEVGIFKPQMVQVESLACGEVGYLICNLRQTSDVTIGDTITDAKNPCSDSLPGYRKFQPMVFCGIYPVNAKDFDALREAMEKLKLTDASFVFEPETSASIGFGFRCGFLGLLHMEIIQERLEREYDLNLVLTTPSVVYRVKKRTGQSTDIDNPTRLPAPQDIDEIEEPFIKAFLIVPADSIGTMMDLAISRRGIYRSTEYLTPDRAKLVFEFPLSEVLVDFYDKIKSVTHGYGSLDYELIGYRPADLVKLDIIINDKVVDAFSSIIHRQKAQTKGQALTEKLKELIPRQLFEVRIQAAIGNKIIASAKVSPLKKHVTAKCYGGDITRKRKLWEIQKQGKKRMKQFGKVEIPQEAFMAALKI